MKNTLQNSMEFIHPHPQKKNHVYYGTFMYWLAYYFMYQYIVYNVFII